MRDTQKAELLLADISKEIERLSYEALEISKTGEDARFAVDKAESMGPKAGTLVIILLGLTLLSDARSFLHSSLDSEKVIKNEKVCTLCEEYVNVAISYLENNQTQAQIIEDLHDRCSHMRGFAQQSKDILTYLFLLPVVGELTP
ncbi:hypothetical protein DY000_02005027 [Brassica cretica]|uniref:Saposin-like type B region 1 domain-containing protein n=1 Tax=Brassica cretica TaxID=69181 RepID=A0ABQ7C3W4_BRACR|nr:hypothetical protein DY000_02005027 [Brassica cretica]